MPTIAEQLTQLTSDRDDLVDNLTTKGITGLTGDETFTELVPEVLNIPSGGNLQSKTVSITQNGTQSVTPDNGYDGLSSVEITTNVSGNTGIEDEMRMYDLKSVLVSTPWRTYSENDYTVSEVAKVENLINKLGGNI